VRASLVSERGGSDVPLGVAYLYGRGQGSQAREQAQVNVEIEGGIARSRGTDGHQLELRVEDLQGNPVDDDAQLEPIDVEVRPR
jgi:hypothetical protein